MKTVNFFIILFAMVVSYAQAHGHLDYAGVFTGTAEGRENQNQLNSCGLVSNDAIKSAVQRFPPTLVRPGVRQQFMYQVTNGDGAGPLDVSCDLTGVGTNFNVTADIVTQVPGANAALTEDKCPGGRFPCTFPLAFTVPNDLRCPNGFCLMRIKNPQNFVSCLFITTNPNFASRFPAMFPAQQNAFLGSLYPQRTQQQQRFF